MKCRKDEEAQLEEFWNLNQYVAGGYDSQDDFANLNNAMLSVEQGKSSNRLFYLALPPSVFNTVTIHVKNTCFNRHGNGWDRVIIEKPFGRDAATSEELSNHLAKLFREDQIYRIDHYLGKEMVQNLMTIRFSNRIFSPTWNNSVMYLNTLQCTIFYTLFLTV
ncbi:glucose-6-phosphate 1-dehydrogenase-like [Sergentomyia squamirostris]